MFVAARSPQPVSLRLFYMNTRESYTLSIKHSIWSIFKSIDNIIFLPELAPAEYSFVVFPHPFDKALLHAFHQLPVRSADQQTR